MDYDVVILGGGPAGYRAAMRLTDGGRKVLIIEKNKIGGTCLHRGCIPTKSMLCSANSTDNYNDIVGKRDYDVQSLYKGLQNQLKNGNIDILNESGRLAGKEGGDFIVSAGDEKYRTRNVIIASGSKNKTLDISSADNNEYLVYSDEFLGLKNIPQKVTIIGGGVIGLEFAGILTKLKKDVTVLEFKNEILEHTVDEDILVTYKRDLLKLNVKFIEGINISEIDSQSVIYEKNGTYDEIESDLIVVAVGRIGNTEDIGLETIGINHNGREIFVDDHCETNVAGIYACGDVIGKNMLAHAAYREAEVVASNILGNQAEMEYRAIPSVIYTNPELAMVGVTEEQCVKQGIQYYVKKSSMLYSSRYLIEYGRQEGVCKIIFNMDSEIIGAQLVGNSSSETIFALADMISVRVTENEIKEKIYPHPSFIEIIKETVCTDRK